MKVSVGKNSEYVNLGDWITYFTYGVLMGKTWLKNTRSNLLNTVNKIIRKAGNKFWDSLPTFILNEIMTRFFD
jgi:hypothetical protein